MANLITFDPDTHTYTLDGQPCPSVTEITRFLHYKAEYADKESRDRAARRGTAIHELTALIDYGEDVDIPNELSGYVQAWENFKRDYRVEIVAIEQVLGGYVSGVYGLCGTLDRRARIEKQRGLIDIKTGWQIQKLPLQAQLNGYDTIDDEHNDFLMGVYLRPDATYTAYQTPEDHDLVRNLMDLHMAERRSKEKWKVMV